MIKCKECHKCCGEIKNLRPVLTPDEAVRFGTFSEIVRTAQGGIHLMALDRTKTHCFFLLQGKCAIYNERPLECRLYPYVLDFDGKKPDLKLDPRHCPKLDTLCMTKEEALELIKGQRFGSQWMAAFKLIDHVAAG